MKTSFSRNAFVVTLFFSLFLLCTGMGGKPLSPDEVATITKVSITDKEVVNKNRPIIVSFSDAMVKDDALDKAVQADDMPFSVTPSIAGEGRWLTTKSFAFTATDGYPRGKQYFVLFKDDLRSVDGKPVRYYFSFSTEGVSVRAVWPRVYDEAKQEIPLIISLNMPVTAEALKEHLTVKDAGSGEALEYTLTDMARDASEHEVVVKAGQYRAKLNIEIALDDSKDKTSLGFAKAYSAAVTITAPVTRSADAAGAQGASSTAVTGTARSDEASPVTLSSPYSDEDEGGINAFFPLSHSLDSDVNQKEFIQVTPDLPYTISSNGYYINFRENVKPGMEISVKLLPGLVDDEGRVLKEARSATLKVRDRYPSVRFTENGSYLTPVYGSRIGLSMVNVDKVSVSLYRQYDNNLPFMSLSDGSDSNSLARSLVYKELELTPEKNEDIRRSLDLESLAKGQRGVFIVNIDGYVKVNQRNGESYYSHRGSDRRVVVLSDIGLTTRVFPAGATVFASSLSTGKPLPGASVRIYSASNQIIAEGKTGADGLFIVKRDKPWDTQLTPNVAAVSTDTDISFLPFDYHTSISLPDPASRDYLSKGNEAFLYTPRGVFRPGEKVDVKAFVRDAGHNAPTPFPVVFSVTSSRGLEISRGSAKLSDEGGADYSFTLPTSAPTGEYTAALSIPGQEKERLGLVRFSVEDFVPPRLEVAVAPEKDILIGSDSLNVALSGQYLFGAPGAELNYEIGYRVSPKMFSPEGWDGYVFGNLEQEFAPSFDLRYITGALGEDGTVQEEFKSPGWQPYSIASVQVVGSVQEDGGRWVTQTNSFTYYPTPYLLGIKIEGDLAPGKKGAIQVAAVTPEGKTADPGKLSVEISQLQGDWHTVYRDGRYVYTWNERILRVNTLEVDTKDGKGTFNFTPSKYGRYLIRCATQDGSVVAARRVSAWESGGYHSEEGTGRMDQVELSFDKKEYLPGDVAKLSVKAPYAGTLLLGVERGEQVSARVVPMPQASTIVEIPVTKDMDPNVTVTAWVYRPVQGQEREWYAHRAYGSIALLMSKAPHTLKVAAQTPERAEPSKGLKIPFTVTDADGKPVAGEFSVALVDEGILSLTAFKTPDPLAFFMEQRRAVGSSYDGYDALLRPEAKATPLLLPGGDSAAEDYQGSLTTQQIFLAGFVPTVRTGADGTGEAFFDIPEYSGKGRLMIVGASGDGFASGASQIRVARDIVVEAAAPRAVAPGDTFDVSLKAFAMEGGLSGTAEISVEADGPLSLSGNLKTQVPLGGKAAGDAKGPKTHSFTVAAKAENASGIATISVNVKVPGRDDLQFTKYLEVAVRPPYPRTSQMQSALIKAGDKETLSFKDKWVKDTVKTSLSVTNSPVFSVLPALEYLREYPYGCLEQTISRAWPYLTLNEVHSALYPNEDEESSANNSNEILASVVSRLASMQTSDGGFGMWPGYSYPNSWKSGYAAFFLVEAKSKVSIPAGTLSRSLDYMRFILAAPVSYFGSKEYAYTTKAFAAFVLTRAGEAPLAWIQHLSGQQDKMWPSGRIFLAAAKSLKAGNPAALRELKEPVLKLNMAKLGYNESLESTLRNQALLLMAWSLVAPEDPETGKLCVALAESITKTSWLTTQDAGMASMAFGYYLGKTKLQDKAFTAEITAAGEKIGETLKGEPLLLGYSSMPLTKDGNPEDITVKVGGKGQAYVIYNARGVSFEPPKPGANNMDVEWTWFGPDNKPIKLDSGDIILKRGDRITMEVKVRSKVSLSDAVLSVLLPGGLEVENPRLKTSGGDDGESGYESDRQEGYSSDEGESENYDEYEGEDEGDYEYRFGNGMYMDLREDRLLLFFDRLYGGADWTTYTFTMRAVSKGVFLIPPVAAEGMYNPEINATTRTGKVVIE